MHRTEWFRRGYIALAGIALCLSFGCRKSSWRAIPEKELPSILGELYWAESLFDQLHPGESHSSERDSVKILILQERGYTLTDLDSTLYNISKGRLNHTSEIVGQAMAWVQQKRQTLETWQAAGATESPFTGERSLIEVLRASRQPFAGGMPISLIRLNGDATPYTLTEESRLSSHTPCTLRLSGVLQGAKPRMDAVLSLHWIIYRNGKVVAQAAPMELSQWGAFYSEVSLSDLQRSDLISLTLVPVHLPLSSRFTLSGLTLQKLAPIETQTSDYQPQAITLPEQEFGREGLDQEGQLNAIVSSMMEEDNIETF